MNTMKRFNAGLREERRRDSRGKTGKETKVRRAGDSGRALICLGHDTRGETSLGGKKKKGIALRAANQAGFGTQESHRKISQRSNQGKSKRPTSVDTPGRMLWRLRAMAGAEESP